MDSKKKEGILSTEEVRAISERFKKSLADGDLFIFTLGGREHVVIDVAPMSHTTAGAPSTLVLMVWGSPLVEVLKHVPKANRARVVSLPRIELPMTFEGYKVNQMAADR